MVLMLTYSSADDMCCSVCERAYARMFFEFWEGCNLCTCDYPFIFFLMSNIVKKLKSARFFFFKKKIFSYLRINVLT